MKKPPKTLRSKFKSIPQRFYDKMTMSLTGCWLWTGAVSTRGYAVFSYDRHGNVRHNYAHRWSYEYFIGPIPEGMTIDHAWERGCRTRVCVNPAHLELVTMKENILRGNGAAVRNHLALVARGGATDHDVTACIMCRWAALRDAYQQESAA